jgi:hypothetical protein
MDAVSTFRREHRQIAGLLLRLRIPGGSDGPRHRLFQTLVEAIRDHEAMESRLLRLCMAEAPTELGPEAALTLRLLAEMKTALSGIGQLDPVDDEFIREVDRLRFPVERHVRVAETRLFPKLNRIWGPGDLDRLLRSPT